MLRLTSRMRPEVAFVAPAPPTRVVPSGAGLPDFLADSPVFNRRR